jgi:hypothetical protein
MSLPDPLIIAPEPAIPASPHIEENQAEKKTPSPADEFGFSAHKREKGKDMQESVYPSEKVQSTTQETIPDTTQKNAYGLRDNAIPSLLSQTPSEKQTHVVKASIINMKTITPALEQAKEKATIFFLNAISIIKNFIHSQVARNKYYPIAGIILLLVISLTVLSLFLTYKGSNSLLKAASNASATASLSAQLLSQTATPSADAKNPAEITWISDLHNSPGNSIDFYKGPSASESGKLFKNGNTGDETSNRKNAPDMKATIIGNFTLEAKVLMNDPAEADTEKIFAAQILEYTPDPASSPFLELQHASQRGTSRFSIFAEGLDKRIGFSEKTASTSASPSADLAKSTVLGVTEEISTLATSSAYLQIQRGSGNIMFKTSLDGKSWQSVGQRLVNNLTKQVTVRLFVYSPSKTPVSAVVQNLSVITKTNISKDANLLPSIDGRKPIQQWAYKARASSDYSNNLWSSMQATGEPNTASCGDHPTAWASKTATGKEWLEVMFQKPVIPAQIRIRQTNNPGHIYQVEVRNGTDSYTSIWKDVDLTDCNEDLVIPATDITMPISNVRISVDETNQNDWNEIDAVSLIGYEE